MTRIPLAGLSFDDMDAGAAAAWIAERPADATFAYVVTPNADHLVRLDRDPALCALYLQAGLCLLDSRVVGGLARFLGLRPPAVAPGSDVVARLLGDHLRPGDAVTIIGLAPGWLPTLVARYQLVAPAHYDPPWGFDQDPTALAAAVAFVRAHPARFVFIATGSPRQERLAAAILAAGDATGTGLCIGASLEFLAGARRRSPGFIRRAGLEWLFRLGCEPRRLWRRYLLDSPRVIELLARQRFG